MVKIKELIWDSWNVEHIARHDITPKEVEIALRDRKRKALRTYGGRLLILGRSGKKLLTVVLAPEEKEKYYVVTARDMSKKEREFYRNEREKKDSKI